jgi:hypothetical protein
MRIILKFSYIVLALAIAVTFGFSSCGKQDPFVRDLSGNWTVALDSTGSGLTSQWQELSFNHSIRIPGTTDEARLGTKTRGAAYGNLSRVYKFIGPAWYQRNIKIPASWGEQPVTLFLERVLWESRVWIDERPVGSRDALGTPHIYNLGLLEPGQHTLTIRINNEMIHNIGDKGHAYSESMQSIWNGMVGRIELQAKPQPSVSHSRILCEPGSDRLSVDLIYVEPLNQSITIRASIFKSTGRKPLLSRDYQLDPVPGQTTASRT